MTTPQPAPGSQARARLFANIAWFTVATIGVMLLRRDVTELTDVQVQTGQFLATTAVVMIVPMYLMNIGFEALFGGIFGKVGLSRESTLGERSLSLVDRVFDVAFIALGVYTVALLGAIDIFAGIMALATLFVGVLLAGMARMPMGRLTAGCGGLIAGVQLLMIGFVLLIVYVQTPEGGDLGIGALLALIVPGLRMFVVAGIGLWGLWGDFRRGIPPGVE